MADFFDKNLLQNIIGGIIVLLISILFARKTLSAPTTSAKKWKAVVILGNFMIFGGFLSFGTRYAEGGFNNPYASIGLLSAVFGFPVKYLGKFFVWWHR